MRKGEYRSTMACKHSNIGRPALTWVCDTDRRRSAHATGTVAQRIDRGIGGLLNRRKIDKLREQ